MAHGKNVNVDTADNEKFDYQLICEKKYSLQAEFAVTKVEKILEGGSKEVDDHGVVVAFRAEPTDKRYADSTSEGLVDLRLILKLGMFRLHGLELDGNLLPGNDVDSKVDVTYVNLCQPRNERHRARGTTYQRSLSRSSSRAYTFPQP